VPRYLSKIRTGIRTRQLLGGFRLFGVGQHRPRCDRRDRRVANIARGRADPREARRWSAGPACGRLAAPW